MKHNQFAVIGLGRFGSSLALTLARQGSHVLGVDENEEIVNDMANKLTHAVVANATDEDALRSLGVRNFDVVVVAIGTDMEASIFTTILLKELGAKYVVAKALSEIHGRVLSRIGADKVVYPERDMGVRVANQLVSPNLLDVIELSKDYSVAELSVPPRLSGYSIKDLDPRKKYGCSIVAINKKSGVVIAPTAADLIHEGDIMVIIGTNEQIEIFEKEVMD
jgi:trk system potassium uptake protein TrkA